MHRDSRLPALTGLRWAAALVVFGQHTLELFYDPDLVAPRPVRAVLWAVLVNGGATGVPTVWTRPLLRYLGEVSFAFYLVHYLTYLGYGRLGLLPRPRACWSGPWSRCRCSRSACSAPCSCTTAWSCPPCACSAAAAVPPAGQPISPSMRCRSRSAWPLCRAYSWIRCR